MIPGEAARRDERGLIRFRAAVGEETLGQLAARRDLGDPLGQRRLRLIREHGGDMLQLVDLLMHLLIHRFIAMADADGHDAAEEIEVLIPVDVPDVLIFRLGHHQRLFEIVKNAGKQMLLIRENDFLFGHGWLRPSLYII